jgi:hypothetical protein
VACAAYERMIDRRMDANRREETFALALSALDVQQSFSNLMGSFAAICPHHSPLALTFLPFLPSSSYANRSTLAVPCRTSVAFLATRSFLLLTSSSRTTERINDKLRRLVLDEDGLAYQSRIEIVREMEPEGEAALEEM